MKRKTQVFLSPEGDHYRTRLTHTLEVAQIARTIARALRLNEDLTEAISLGHDLGHTPFGHAGERALNEILPGGFRHYEQSVRVVEKLEKNGAGLNLTKEVRDGISVSYTHLDGCPAYAFVQNSDVDGGAMSKAQAAKIKKIYDLAVKTGSPVVGIYDSIGGRLNQGADMLAAYGEILLGNNNLSGVVPQISLVLGPCLGTSAMIAASADIVVMTKRRS